VSVFALYFFLFSGLLGFLFRHPLAVPCFHFFLVFVLFLMFRNGPYIPPGKKKKKKKNDIPLGSTINNVLECQPANGMESRHVVCIFQNKKKKSENRK